MNNFQNERVINAPRHSNNTPISDLMLCEFSACYGQARPSQYCDECVAWIFAMPVGFILKRLEVSCRQLFQLWFQLARSKQKRAQVGHNPTID